LGNTSISWGGIKKGDSGLVVKRVRTPLLGSVFPLEGGINWQKAEEGVPDIHLSDPAQGPYVREGKGNPPDKKSLKTERNQATSCHSRSVVRGVTISSKLKGQCRSD